MSQTPGYVWKCTLETSHQTTVWWDWFRQDADATITLFAQDAERISRRDKTTCSIEQRVFGFKSKDSTRGPAAVCEILNGTWPSKIELRIGFKDGEIEYFERSMKHGLENCERLPLTLGEAPTLEYAQAYSELLRNPALYQLCARARSVGIWLTAADRACWKKNRNILRWLYRKVH